MPLVYVGLLYTYILDIATVINRENNQTLTDIDNRLEELQTQLLKLASSKAEYEDVADEIHRLRDQSKSYRLKTPIVMNSKSAWLI